MSLQALANPTSQILPSAFDACDSRRLPESIRPACVEGKGP